MKNIKVCPADGRGVQGGFRFDRASKQFSVWGRTVELTVTLDDAQIQGICEALADETTATVHAAGEVVGRVWEVEA
jgi:hypothetical protein